MDDKINNEKLLICEGREDFALVRAMITEGRAPIMDVRFMGDNIGHSGGIDALKEYLIALRGLSGFRRVRSLGILVDNDDNPELAFEKVRHQILEVNNTEDFGGIISLPKLPFEKSGECLISVLVILLPGNNEFGCLETLLCRAVNDLRTKEAECIEKLLECAGLVGRNNGWSQSKLDKARIRIAIAILHKRNPALTLTRLWENRPDLVPVNHPAFDELSHMLFEI